MMDIAKDGMQHDKMHWHCCWMPMLGKLLWVLAFLEMIGALLAYWSGGEFLGVHGMTWLWFSLVKGVLATGAKMKPHWCSCTQCSSGKPMM
ncbi:MAG: hypothetical protein HY220_00755 [Candidatus Sungbacteria bacterium]|uniref:Uncharacterized protein n=1 Tax=Candidatus Sungiibacteriota bacterium TaxID=2750080 RepID=A0A9D6LPA6_9BACT|nr:hypothetical protein [Candidatus Sungbacteria bacterium]